MNLLSILSIFSLSFLIIQMDGPWDIIGKLRNLLMRNKYVGVFFYKLLSCYYCTGCHAGYLIYLLNSPHNNWNIFDFIMWMLSGGTISFVMNLIVSKLINE